MRWGGTGIEWWEGRERATGEGEGPHIPGGAVRYLMIHGMSFVIDATSATTKRCSQTFGADQSENSHATVDPCAAYPSPHASNVQTGRTTSCTQTPKFKQNLGTLVYSLCDQIQDATRLTANPIPTPTCT
jgi:hypothetical protein